VPGATLDGEGRGVDSCEYLVRMCLLETSIREILVLGLGRVTDGFVIRASHSENDAERVLFASLDSHGRGNRLTFNVPQIDFGLFFSLRSTGLVNFGQE
jgi:hypothetical protein